MMTAKDIQERLTVDLLVSKDIVIPNYFVGHYECDLYRINKAGYTTDYEIKISRSDFLMDFKKSHKEFDLTPDGKHIYETKHIAGSNYSVRKYKDVKKHDFMQAGNHTNKFYFVCPKGLIDINELPAKYGLIYISGDEKPIHCQEIRRAGFFHKNKVDIEAYKHAASNLTYRCLSLSNKVRKYQRKEQEAKKKAKDKKNDRRLF